VCRDVTERRRAEEALQRSNKQTVDILESIRDGFLALDRDWVFTYVNAEAERRLGKSRTELLGKDYWRESPGVAESPTGTQLRRCVAEQTPVSFEEHRPDLGGWFEVNLYPAPEGGLSMYFRDVTGRKRTEEALRESEEQLRLSADAAEIGAWNQDCETGRVHWSPQLERLYGLDPGAFRGTIEHRLELIHPEDRQRVTEAFRRAIAKDTDFEVEHRLARPDGEARWLLSRGRALYTDGRVVALAGVTMDITSRRRLEEKLRQSQKLESLGVLAGGIAHDFNNLLVGILGNASMLMEETPPDSPSRELIENLTQASERAAHLTRQMLAYSGKGRFVVERLNLGRQVREILALIEASIPKRVKVELNFEDPLPPIEGDAGQIQQLIMNLLINGAEAIGPGGGTISVTAALLEIGKDYVRDNLAGDNIPAGAYVALEVRDNGIGMDAATQARIFDPFFTTKFTGRGLGLAAVLGIVRGHRGALTVHSEPGRGASFKILLPAATVEQPAGPSPLPEADGFRGAGTILVVDDEELVQRTLKIALERYGYTVVTASGGEAAIRFAEEAGDAISLVLLDMTMPGMSGEETLQHLRISRPHVPVVATSGYNEVEALRRFGAGLSGFIQKPYTPRKLAAKIRDVLTSASPAAV
jgi:PAS domain S-box-containing protein